MTNKIAIGAITRDEGTPVESRRYLVTLAFWRAFGGAITATSRELWFTGGRFERWPKAKTWLSFEARTAAKVAALIAAEWGES